MFESSSHLIDGPDFLTLVQLIESIESMLLVSELPRIRRRIM